MAKSCLLVQIIRLTNECIAIVGELLFRVPPTVAIANRKECFKMDLFSDNFSEALFHFMSSNDDIYNDWCLALGRGFDYSMAEWVQAHYSDEFQDYLHMNGYLL